jgi:hypothetical protein
MLSENVPYQVHEGGPCGPPFMRESHFRSADYRSLYFKVASSFSLFVKSFELTMNVPSAVL